MIAPLLRGLFESLLRLYYPDIAIDGREHVPAAGPVIVVLNHPNALLDPLLLRVALGRPVRFLGKSTLFHNPVSRAVMNAFGGIPVHRHRDKAAGADPAQNELTFARCRETLAGGGWIALFPEGTSHSDPTLKPLKTGAARIALSALDAHPEAASLVVLPAGLYYEHKSTFRSRVLVRFGPPLPVAPRLAAYRDDPRGAVDALTDTMREALDRVVLQADTQGLLENVARVAVWASDAPDARDDLATRHRRAQALLDAHRSWSERDPARVAQVVDAAQRYTRILQGLGIDDPWSLEAAEATPARVLWAGMKLAALAPFALMGAALGWAPYRLAGRVAARVAGTEDELGTVKLLAGALFVLLAWVLEAVAVGFAVGPLAALVLLAVAAPCGYAALRFEERWDALRKARQAVTLQRRHVDVARAVAQRRRELAAALDDALRAEAP